MSATMLIFLETLRVELKVLVNVFKKKRKSLSQCILNCPSPPQLFFFFADLLLLQITGSYILIYSH